MKNVHIVTHAHWDREWYLPFEAHRARLIDLIDDCIERLEHDPEFKSFHLDDQSIPLEDYLEIKPQNRERLIRLVKCGKLKVGPWYILQDEFLTSGESNVRNLLVGMQIAKDFGGVNMIGYLPDAFGNAGQMPQIFKQAGLKAAVFGRGVKPTGMANQVYDFDCYKSQYSEMYWQSPDGSRVPAILFANWYANGKEIPTDNVRKWWDERLSAVEKYASTDELLLMNGGDHCPIQSGLTEAITKARAEYPDYNFIHSSLEDHIDAVMKSIPKDVGTVYGELTSQDTNGYGTLVNTCSTLTRIKRMNRECEIALENAAEPLSVIAATLGKEYPRDMLRYAWKSLMKNHPHDSICGCNCDEVNLDVERRYANCRHTANAIIAPTLEYIAEYTDTKSLSDADAVFTVVNTYGKDKSGVISLTVDTERLYGQQQLSESRDALLSRNPDSFIVIDEDGNTIPATVEPLMPRFGYVLPSDKFRLSYFASSYRVTLEATDVPAMGVKAYGLKKGSYARKRSMVIGDGIIENEHLKVKISKCGTVELTHKSTGRVFKELLKYEDVDDRGNEYTFSPMKDYDAPIYSDSGKAEIELIRDEEYIAEYKITTVIPVPVSADPCIEEQIMLWQDKTKKRSSELTELKVDTYVTLEQSSKALLVRTVIDNKAKDHRLRVIIPTGLDCTEHRAESTFEAVTRNNRHKSTWTNPSECEHQQGFVMMSDSKSGLAVGNIGIYEYEILKDNSIALTLLRCTGEIRDWGVFPTKLSQCIGVTELCYSIVPFESEDEGFKNVISLQYPFSAIQKVCYPSDIKAPCNTATPAGGIFEFDGDCIRLTGFKAAEDGEDFVARFVNYSTTESELKIAAKDWFSEVRRSNVIESDGDPIEKKDGFYFALLRPHEIFTVRLKKD